VSAVQAAWSQAPAPGNLYELAVWEEDDDGLAYDYLFMVTPVELEHEFWAELVLGSRIDPNRQLPRLALALLAVFGGTLVLAFGGGFWLADRAMRPVQIITRTAQDIGEHDLNRRLNLGRSDEIGELAATFDRMLARLQAAFDRQRQFTADASHEFRTPLTIIELETNRALEKVRSSTDYQNALRTIQSENELLSRLVDGLLTLARMDSGRAVLKPEQLDVSDVAMDVAGRLSGLAKKKGVRLVLEKLDEGPVRADRTYLAQLLTNLVENAIKYADGPSPSVILETGIQAGQGSTWSWVTVEDNGPGISQEHLPHLFDRFYRVDEARGRESNAATSGSGLGLAIADSITRALQGRLEVNSEVGKGTVFKVWLPAS
jgi:signal transduction histidine kinase